MTICAAFFGDLHAEPHSLFLPIRVRALVEKITRFIDLDHNVYHAGFDVVTCACQYSTGKQSHFVCVISNH